MKQEINRLVKNDIGFSKELGIACQKLLENVTINDLWKIIK